MGTYFIQKLNPQLQSRHTIAIDEGESAFFYCSFDGYPTPSIEWYHTDLKTLSTFGAESIAQSSFTIGYEPYVAHSSSNNNVNVDPNGPVPISKQTSNIANGQYIYGRNFLVIERVSIEDTGIISCVANNTNSIIRHEMFLFVKSNY
ncbi:hypothetical protein BLA29_009993 [Euroglyphus maynei]|uniref:Ig-like domain-containing protein n=1 Tax=Euroglyphus maynei TaxID=6958 RepID=A0A1Y3AR58_EURMA|nr:hypothetical protein BLA29_009993 [Euroglyphus maynei]